MLFGLFKNKNAIDPKKAKENMQKDSNIILVDVREADEYKSGHIPGAKLVPLSSLATLDAPKEAEIYVYCHSGARSARAVAILETLGYTGVRDLGGIMSWPYEIEK